MMGNQVTVGHRVILHGCIVEDDCLIGMGAVLFNRVRIGKGSVVGAGGLVLERTDVPAGSLVLGFPAKVVRPVDDSMRERIEHAWRRSSPRPSATESATFPSSSPRSPETPA